MARPILYGEKDRQTWERFARQGVSCRAISQRCQVGFDTVARHLKKVGLFERRYSTLPRRLVSLNGPRPTGPIGAKLPQGVAHIISINGLQIQGVIFNNSFWIEVNPQDHHADVIQRHCKSVIRFWPLVAQQIMKKEGLELLLAMPDDSPLGWCNLIQHRTGTLSEKRGARELQVTTIANKTAKAFYQEHHIQGGRSGLHQALVAGSDIRAVMTFGRPADCRSRSIESANHSTSLLARLAIKGSVPGGASRLLAAGLRERPGQSVVSFSDNRYTSGAIYRTLGFKEKSRIIPTYRYYKDGKIYFKEKLQKRYLAKVLNKDPETFTESEAARKLGFLRLYDMGKVKWMLDYNLL